MERKSDIVRAVAEKLNIPLIDIKLSEVDLSDYVGEGGKTIYYPKLSTNKRLAADIDEARQDDEDSDD